MFPLPNYTIADLGGFGNFLFVCLLCAGKICEHFVSMKPLKCNSRSFKDLDHDTNFSNDEGLQTGPSMFTQLPRTSKNMPSSAFPSYISGVHHLG